MDTVLIILIIGLASVYLLRKFSQNIRNTGKSQCGCSCTSCPGEKSCTPPPPNRP